MRAFLRDFKKGFVETGNSIAVVVNTALLFIVYLIGVGFSRLIFVLTRKEAMKIGISKNKKTYWKTLNLAKRPVEEYYRQF